MARSSPYVTLNIAFLMRQSRVSDCSSVTAGPGLPRTEDGARTQAAGQGQMRDAATRTGLHNILRTIATVHRARRLRDSEDRGAVRFCLRREETRLVPGRMVDAVDHQGFDLTLGCFHTQSKLLLQGGR
jgi:hypothetical protein